MKGHFYIIQNQKVQTSFNIVILKCPIFWYSKALKDRVPAYAIYHNT